MHHINLQKRNKEFLDRAKQDKHDRKLTFDECDKLGGVKINSKEAKYLDKNFEVNNFLPETKKNKLPGSITAQDFYATRTERFTGGYSEVGKFMKKSRGVWNKSL